MSVDGFHWDEVRYSISSKGPFRAQDPLLEETQEDGKTGESLSPNSFVRQCGLL